ncbi:type III-B CRISPR module RAMP protein Cmr6 [Myxococcus landrumensis]|uniref:Type III-B CRISPR module RAMP protein Cmr6 n=1 Tax=Myxococcus landrumensis TaxID=2813577 RepID=A0ABX7N0Z9_9BACT|nr:type III-B CRISPR module RAMP protein Cmr6 [Myxococcus landrumus]QSQ12148.1 type III-B CRISPR module RAMP protein Cmr6 [Myxococcus landrumus]
MRNDLRGLSQALEDGPAHAGLAHERYAPVKDDLEEKESPWRKWLQWMEEARVPRDYTVAFSRWRESLRQWHTASVTVRAASRLLVGHGNASPTGVGLTLHHTWGVPVIPGSSLKGVLAAYLRAAFEPAEVEVACRRLFGVPGDRLTGQGATTGEVIFHDALWVASPVKKEEKTPLMLARDVLTVHQKTWYGGATAWPNDYDSPNPVAFLSVRPEGRFLLALSVAPGADAESVTLLRWAGDRLCEALSQCGVGGKTSAGYGRLTAEGEVVVNPPRAVSRPSPVRDEFKTWLDAQREAKTEQRKVLEDFESEWLRRLSTLPLGAREECAQAMRTLVKKNPKLQERRDDLLARLLAPSTSNH